MPTETPALIVHNHLRSFGVRIVRRGDRYGLNDCLTHDEDHPMVEFYDRTYCNNQGFGPRGQFISRYYVKTLLRGTGGLCLHGGCREWDQTDEAMAQVRALLATL